VFLVEKYALNDGRKVTIRPIRTSDAERLRTAHGRLSAESKYRRFLAAKPHLSQADVRYLVEIDGYDHFALVATIDDRGEEAIIAVARFIRLADATDTAEFAIVVGDPYQRQGLAGILLERLVAAARARDVHRFRATMLADNVPIHRLIERFAADRITSQVSDGEINETEFDLDERRHTPGAAPGWSPTPAIIAACAGS
jgi:RimJ/RimL family protein N-acetyltransferase